MRCPVKNEQRNESGVGENSPIRKSPIRNPYYYYYCTCLPDLLFISGATGILSAADSRKTGQ